MKVDLANNKPYNIPHQTNFTGKNNSLGAIAIEETIKDAKEATKLYFQPIASLWKLLRKLIKH